MKIDVISIFPELFSGFLETSLMGRALRQGLLEVRVRDLRHHAIDRHRSVDDVPYGGGGGMVMMAPPWLRAVRAVDPEHEALRVLLSPQGETLDEEVVRDLAARSRLVLLCGRYEGIDERVRELLVDREISIGDYVLSGGELPAMVLIEAISRQVPGVVGLADSVENDSFRSGLLDHPHYTRPPEVEGLGVPPVLVSGDHAAIARWRQERALESTRRKRPDLLAPDRAMASDGASPVALRHPDQGAHQRTGQPRELAADSRALEVGLVARETYRVTEELTASQPVTDAPATKVLSKRAIRGYVESACRRAIEGFLTASETTIGRDYEVSVLDRVAVGEQLTVRAQLSEIDHRELRFEVEVWSMRGLVGQGRHRRLVVEVESSAPQ